MRYLLCLVVCANSLTACSTIADNTPSTIKENRSSLSAKTLSTGECGLFVWSADNEKQFILFAQSQNNIAEWLSDTGPEAVRIKSQSGTPTQQQYPHQTYEGDEGLELNLQSVQSITNGTRYKSGTLRRASDNGWDVVMPVVGLSTCQT